MPKTASFLLLMLVLFLLLAPATGSAQERPEPMTPIRAQPDHCEPNDSPERACTLPLDTVSGSFSLPDGDQDYFSVDLGDTPTGLALEITMRVTAGLDLRVSVNRAGDAAPLAILSTPALSTTLPVELTGWVVLRVENRSPATTANDAYTIELRRILPPPPLTPNALAVQPAPTPDQLENNWSPATAAPIAVGVVYDLSFACPVTGGCPGGDHDYLAVAVKAGLNYQIATFDLGPGVDTVIELFWNDLLVAGNDDARPGTSFLSTLAWIAPADGLLIIRIGPRTGGVNQLVLAKNAGGYRFAIALAESDLARQLRRRIAEQTGAPAAQSAGPAAGTAASTPTNDAPKGSAIVHTQSTALRDAPAADATVLATLPQETIVELLGQANGVWVRVQPENGVIPGWVYGPDLRRIAVEPQSATAIQQPTTTPELAIIQPDAATTQPTPALPRITALEPMPASAPPVPARIPLALSVSLAAHAVTAAPTGRAVPTPAPGTITPLAGVRVQLITVFGDVLAEAITNSAGQISFSRDLPPGTAALLRIPALGILAPVDPATRTMSIVIPKGAEA